MGNLIALSYSFFKNNSKFIKKVTQQRKFEDIKGGTHKCHLRSALEER